jgi:DNA-binding HxlR family transcriptional regulator
VSRASDCGCSVQDGEIGSCYCVLEPLVQAVGRRHALPIMNVIAARGPVRFNEIQQQLQGLSSSTLAERLRELEAVGLIRRKVQGEDGPRAEYGLTAKGKTLRNSLREFFPGGRR